MVYGGVGLIERLLARLGIDVVGCSLGEVVEDHSRL